jgi:aspartate aminotransferase
MSHQRATAEKPRKPVDHRAAQQPGPNVQLNLNVRGLPTSATVAINERSDALRRAGRRVFKLGLGQSPFPVPECVVEELRRNAHRKEYLPVKGLRELREAVAGHYRRTFDIECSPDDVLVGPGSKELMFLLQLVYYGDLVIPTPSWVSYAPQAQIIGRQVRLLPTYYRNRWRLSPEQLEELCRSDPGRPRIVVLNYPSNPTGASYTDRELRRLADVAQRYRVILLSDEIYGKLHHEGRHTSAVRHYPSGTIFSSGLSKWCGAGGWRLGVFVFPPHLHWLRDAMAAVASETFTSTSAPIQYAAVRAFKANGELDRYLFQSRRILRALGRRLTSMVKAAGAEAVAPDGAFYLFPRFKPLSAKFRVRGIVTAAQLCERLLEDTGVAILPGSEFGRPPAELTARIAYVDFDGARVLEAAAFVPEREELSEAFLREHCSDTLEAVERLCNWIAG